VVSLTWRLEDAQGQLIDELSDPMEFLVGGEDLLPKVEAALIGQTTGFETTCISSQNTRLAITTRGWCFLRRASCFLKA